MNVSRETKRSAYIELLQRWNAKLNLTSSRDSQPECLAAHYKNSLLLLPYLPPGLTRLIDLGSGQGFPAIPLAIEADVEIDLIEADRRKAAFLTTTMAQLQLRGTVKPSRIEATRLVPAACVTARALASVGQLAALAAPFVADEGCCLFLKGPTAVQEAAAVGWPFAADILPTSQVASCIVRLIRVR